MFTTLLHLLKQIHPKEDQDEFYGWMCVCGNWEETDMHCSHCGAEPPWGCDCGEHDEDDDWNDEPFFYDDQD